MRVMQNPMRIPASKMFPVTFPAACKPGETLKVGDRFQLLVSEAGQQGFGPLQESGVVPEGAYFEAVVQAVGNADTGAMRGRSAAVFSISFYVMPHPDKGDDWELAIPVKAVVTQEPENQRFDGSDASADFARVAASIGQLSAGIDGFFTAEAFATLLSKFGVAALGQDQSTLCSMGDVQAHTPGFVQIREDAIF
jgi:hypothetical protein